MAETKGVLDSSVLIPALLSPEGPGTALLNAARLDRFQLVVSSDILDEVRRSLVDDFDVTPTDADELLRLVMRVAEVHEPTNVPRRARDESDDHVLALADQCGAAFLATYDHDLMAVHAVGSCGVVDPVTALQLVRNLNIEAWDEGIPGVGPETR